MDVPNLILIRHSISKMDASAPASEWRLTHEGRELCAPLAERLRTYRPTLLVSSTEPKAIETARLTGEHLGIPSEIAFGLHEHERGNVGMLSVERFKQSIEALFAKPGELVFGKETADEAEARFTQAIEALVVQHEDDTLGVVSHGTVISLLVARKNGLDAFTFWKQLEMPALVVLALPGYEIVEIEGKIDA